jgi:hypothetical protein
VTESIKVYFEPLGGGNTYNHETLVYTNSAGEQFLATAYAVDSPSSGSLLGNDPSASSVYASNFYNLGAASNSLAPLMFCNSGITSDATGLVTAAEKRGFCRNKALRTVDPERGRPEIR